MKYNIFLMKLAFCFKWTKITKSANNALPFLFLLLVSTICITPLVFADHTEQLAGALTEVRIDSLNDLAVSLQQAANYKESQLNAYKALELAKREGYEYGVARALSAIAVNYFRTGQYTQSIDYMDKGLEIARKRGDSSDIAIGLNNIGSIYTFTGNFEEALRHHKEALRITTLIKSTTGIATSRGNIGNVYFYLNDYDATLEHYLAALQAYEQLNGIVEMMILNINIGNVYLKKAEHDLALAHLLTAIELNEQVRNDDFMADVYNNIGTIYAAQDRLEEALNMHQSSLKLKQEVNDRNGIVNSHRNLGITYLKKNEFELARVHLMQALDLSLTIGNKQSISDIYNSLSSLDSTAGNFLGALAHYQLYTSYKDSIINEATNQAIAALRIEYETEQKDAEIALLQKERNIQELEIQKNLATIKAINLDVLTQKQEIELQELSLRIKDRELIQHKTELEANATKLELARLSNELNEREVLRQKNHKRIMLFALLGFLAFAGGGIHFYLYRKRTVQKLKETALELKLLRTQIKPHFVFNALNSMNNFIQSNDNEKASNYLLKFSTLMRLLLDGSRQEEITLKEELRLLELYLDLEKCNLDEKLTYTIEVDEKIDAANTIIFPFLIQPFIENAIIHGITPKATSGHLHLKILRDQKLLFIHIEDNGIGRKAALARPNSNILKHKSHGINISAERLQFLSQKHKVNCEVKFTDLDEGLRVELSLPYIEVY